MKKFVLVLALTVLALTAFTLPVSQPAAAASPDDLTALAAFAPADAFSFIAIRTDQGYIDALDGLIDRVNAATGTQIDSLDDLINLLVLSLPNFDGDFDENVRPWLGDTAAAWLPETLSLLFGGDMNAGVIALSVTDAAAAEAFLDTLLANAPEGEELAKSSTDDGTLYAATEPGEGSLLLTETALFITADFDDVVLPGDDVQSLEDTANFAAGLDALPGDDYNIIAYSDTTDLFSFLADQVSSADLPPGITLDFLNDISGPAVAGFTILNGRTLTIDTAQVANGLPPAFEALQTAPLDLSLMESIPAETALLIAGSGMGDQLAYLSDAFYALSDYLVEMGLDLGAELGLEGFQLRDIATFLRFAFRATYGVEVRDVLGWLDGSSATLFTVAPGGPMGVTFGGGTIYTTDDPEATAAFVEGQSENLLRIFPGATFEDGIITISEEAQVMAGMPATVIGSNDSVYVSGSIDAVGLALGLTDGDAITSTDAYIYEAGLFVENPNSVWLIAMDPIRDTVAALLDMTGMGDSDDAMVLMNVLGLFESAGISSNASEDGLTTTTRLTLTLSEAAE